MAESRPYPDGGDDFGVSVGRASAPPRPRWVKVLLGIAIVVVVLFVFLLVTGGPGQHGPGRHFGGHDAPAGHQPPAGIRDHEAP